jgi:hypothetical protein
VTCCGLCGTLYRARRRPASHCFGVEYRCSTRRGRPPDAYLIAGLFIQRFLAKLKFTLPIKTYAPTIFFTPRSHEKRHPGGTGNHARRAMPPAAYHLQPSGSGAFCTPRNTSHRRTKPRRCHSPLKAPFLQHRRHRPQISIVSSRPNSTWMAKWQYSIKKRLVEAGPLQRLCLATDPPPAAPRPRQKRLRIADRFFSRGAARISRRPPAMEERRLASSCGLAPSAMRAPAAEIIAHRSYLIAVPRPMLAAPRRKLTSAPKPMPAAHAVT